MTMIETEALVAREHGHTFALEPVLHAHPLLPNEVLVDVKASGICHSDLSCMNGTLSRWPLPTILGHEGAGIVKEVGAQVTKLKPGDAVLTSWAYCRTCSACTTGHPVLCETWRSYNISATRIDGSLSYTDKQGGPVFANFLGQSSFARMMAVDQSSCIKVAPEAPLEDLAPFGCGAITGAGTILNIVKPRAGSSIVVMGVGAVGASAIMSCAISPCVTIIAVDLHQSRLDLALTIGATHVIKAGDGVNVSEEIKKLTGGKGVDYAVECTGVTSCVTQAYEALATGGGLFLVGIPKTGTRLDVDFMSQIDKMTYIKGCLEGDAIPDQLIPFLIELRRQEKFPFERLCKKYSFKDANQAVKDMMDGSVIKPILVWD